MIHISKIALAALLFSSALFADTWAPPKASAFSSPSGARIVRIEPGDSRDARDARRCRALIFKFDPATKDYSLAKELALETEPAPLEAVITDDGRYLVTFDAHAAVGHRGNVIVIYDLSSGMTTGLKLEDFLSETQIQSFPRSTSSRWWRGSPTLIDDGRKVYIAESDFDRRKPYPSFVLDLETKTVSVNEPKPPKGTGKENQDGK